MPPVTDKYTPIHNPGATPRTFGRPVRVLTARRRVLTSLKPYRRGLFVLLLPVGLALTELASRNPQATERLFSRGAYRAMAGSLGRISGTFPFSLAELALYGLCGISAGWLAYNGVCLARRPDRTKRLLSMLATVLCCAGIGVFLFTVTCGLNYHRVSFADQSGLDVRPSSTRELADLYAELVESANEARAMTASAGTGEMILSDSAYGAAAKAPLAVAEAAADYPALEGYAPRAKPVLASRMMSYLDITGIYIPFTFEGNVNTDVPHYYIPFSMVHELAHYKGFMREDEANFIAYAGCRALDDPSFRYSGAVLGMLHAGNALYSADSDLYYELSARISEEVRADMEAGASYWRQFEGPVAEMATKVNDSYLKTNRQDDGVRSYGRMVDLLLADYRRRHGLE